MILSCPKCGKCAYFWEELAHDPSCSVKDDSPISIANRQIGQLNGEVGSLTVKLNRALERVKTLEAKLETSAVKKAIEEEREACADVAQSFDQIDYDLACAISRSILSRGKVRQN